MPPEDKKQIRGDFHLSESDLAELRERSPITKLTVLDEMPDGPERDAVMRLSQAMKDVPRSVISGGVKYVPSQHPRRDMVMAFHEKYKLLGIWNKDESPNAPDILRTAANILKAQSELHGILAKVSGDGRYFESHMTQEEESELLSAIASGDRVKIADGLADLSYILEGIAIKYDIPLEECFAEVHRSNMTKKHRTGDARMKDKGPEYSPPDLERLLREYDASPKTLVVKERNHAERV